MKRKTTRELLAESFREVAEQKPVDKITVKDITENCGYSSATFYRQFTDKYDLMAWEYTRRLQRVMNRLDMEDYGWKQLCTDAAMFYDEQKDYLKNLLLHTSGLDSFARNMKRIHFDVLSRYILKQEETDQLDVKTEMYIRSYCQGTVDLTCDWIMGKYDVSAEELAEVYENFPPAPLRKYLL